MSGIRVAIIIDAPPSAVWEVVAHVASHVEWMQDAVAIRFTTAQDRGVGTTFDCDTRVGLLRLTDRMEITEWVDEQTMGVRHVGVVTGAGRFTLRPVGIGRTAFAWQEQLTFPWWLGGPVAGLIGKPILRAVWQRNLGALKRLVEGGRHCAAGPAAGQGTRPPRDERSREEPAN
jgi:hypothetical protein